MRVIGNTGEYLYLATVESQNYKILTETIESGLSILWFESGINKLVIDGQDYIFSENQIVFLTEFHRVGITSIDKIRFLRFNKPFYCVLGDNIEVGYKRIL